MATRGPMPVCSRRRKATRRARIPRMIGTSTNMSVMTASDSTEEREMARSICARV